MGRHIHFATTWLAAAILASAPAAAQQPSQPAANPKETVTLNVQVPIPVSEAPENCAVQIRERICRTDGVPVQSYTVLQQQVVGRSSVERIAIDRGCLVVDLKLGVASSTTPGAQCVGGEPEILMQLQLSSQPPNR